MARPRSTLAEDELFQPIPLNARERDAIHKLANEKGLSLRDAARALLNAGIETHTATLEPGEYSALSWNLRRAEVRVALDLRNATHAACFKKLLRAVDLLKEESP